HVINPCRSRGRTSTMTQAPDRYLPLIVIFWVYELFEAISHVAYAYRCQRRPARLDDAFRFGTVKETILNTLQAAAFLTLVAAGVMPRLDVGLLGFLVLMHGVFSVSGLTGGRAVGTLAHGYAYGLIPLRSPPLQGPYHVAFLAKLLAHVDSGIHA